MTRGFLQLPSWHASISQLTRVVITVNVSGEPHAAFTALPYLQPHMLARYDADIVHMC